MSSDRPLDAVGDSTLSRLFWIACWTGYLSTWVFLTMHLAIEHVLRYRFQRRRLLIPQKTVSGIRNSSGRRGQSLLFGSPGCRRLQFCYLCFQSFYLSAHVAKATPTNEMSACRRCPAKVSTPVASNFRVLLMDVLMFVQAPAS